MSDLFLVLLLGAIVLAGVGLEWVCQRSICRMQMQWLEGLVARGCDVRFSVRKGRIERYTVTYKSQEARRG